LGNHLPAGIEYPAGQVLRLADDGTKGRAHQRYLLLVGNGEQAIPENFKRDRVKREKPYACYDTRILSTQVSKGAGVITGKI
jgi:hypothetical protein